MRVYGKSCPEVGLGHVPRRPTRSGARRVRISSTLTVVTIVVAGLHGQSARRSSGPRILNIPGFFWVPMFEPPDGKGPWNGDFHGSCGGAGWLQFR